ncbi:MAG: tyrosine-type recombinase/integrase [Gammaproteobacteria bacterium]|nr:tyrosine-type recombinase/integrase [Gammaproteobacteria bacterium]
MGNLTDVQIRHWIKAGRPVSKAQGEVPGLTFTLSASGAAAWVLRYRFSGKPRELSIGRYPDYSIKRAKEEALEARVKIQKGVDVAREKQRENIERAAAQSFKQLAADYMDKVFPRLAANTIKQRRHHIEDVILPKLGKLPARDVTTADVVALIEAVGKRSINVAELVFTATSEIFKHGVARHVVQANPCAGVSVSAICGKPEPKRQRLKLTEEELRVILPALPTIGTENALAVKILLATCVRIGELARAEWAHVDFERAEWFIPDANSKTGKGFTIPLPPAVVGWFEELQPFACGSPYVLPARQQRRRKNNGGDVFFEQRALNAQLHKLSERLGDKVRRFTPHDLRSTARSHLAALGVNLIVAERCLNHSLGGLVAVYDQHDYMTERRAALNIWTDFMLACEAGKHWKRDSGNVVTLRRAGAEG